MTRSAEELFQGAGEMATLCRNHDWAATPLGAAHAWPPALKSLVCTLLSSRQPMLLFWGPELIQFYNDAYRPSLGNGDRHPAGLGARAREFWSDVWETIGPQIDQVLCGGGATRHEDFFLPILRNGVMEDAFWTYGYSPAFDEEGVIQGVLVVCQDTTARVRSEAHTRENWELLEAVGRMARLGGWRLKLGEDHVFWSDEVCALHDLPPGTTPSLEEAIGFYPPEWQPVIMERFTRCVEEGIPYDIELQIETAGGQRRWVQTMGEAVRDEEGVIRAVQGAFLDIANRKKSERELRKSRRRVHESKLRVREQAELLDRAQDAIIVRDLDDRVVFWNAGAERLYGWSSMEVGDLSIREAFYHDVEPFEAARAAVLADGEWNGELKQRRKDGSPVTVEARWSLVRDEEGAPRRILAINTDITERKKLMAQFLRAQRLESIGTLAGGIAHDLNNVLAPILLSIGLLKMEIEGEENRSTLETIESSARRGAGMVSQILGFARGVEGARVNVSFPLILDDLTGIIRDAFPKSIVLERDVPDGLWSLQGDPTQIHQVLMNLFVNARDAMPAGGTLRVSAENVELDEQYVAMAAGAEPGAYLRVTVADSGEGMTEEVQAQVLDPFFTTKEIGQGTGLGLSTVATIMRSHGGFLNIYSEPGSGTTFRLYFPASRDGEEQESREDGEELLRGDGELIMVIDDESAIREITRQTLEAYGYRVAVAGDGAEALALYGQSGTDIDLILTDMMMPVMDGPATIRALRHMDPEIRIVATSGLDLNTGKARAEDLAIDYFLPKPYTAATLLNMIHRVLNEKG